jgi:hypothetical protein
MTKTSTICSYASTEDFSFLFSKCDYSRIAATARCVQSFSWKNNVERAKLLISTLKIIRERLKGKQKLIAGSWRSRSKRIYWVFAIYAYFPNYFSEYSGKMLVSLKPKPGKTSGVGWLYC